MAGVEHAAAAGFRPCAARISSGDRSGTPLNTGYAAGKPHVRRLRQEERVVAIEEHVEHDGAADRGDRAGSTPATSAASSNEARAGFHSVAFGLSDRVASGDRRVRNTRLRYGERGWSSYEFRPCTIRSVSSSAASKNFWSPGTFRLFRHDVIRVGQHAVGGHDGVSDKTKRAMTGDAVAPTQ